MLQNPHSRLPCRNFRISDCLRGCIQDSKCLRYCVTHWQRWTFQTYTRKYSDVGTLCLAGHQWTVFCNIHQTNTLLCVQYIRQQYLTPAMTLLVNGSPIVQSTLRLRPLVLPTQRDHPRSTIFPCQVAIPPLQRF